MIATLIIYLFGVFFFGDLMWQNRSVHDTLISERLLKVAAVVVWPAMLCWLFVTWVSSRKDAS